jgi:membrane protein
MRDNYRKQIDALVEIGCAIVAKYSQVGVSTCASSIAYFTFLSLIPLVTICISLLTAVGVSQQEVSTLFLSITPNEFHNAVNNLVADAFAESEVALSLSSVTLLWSVSKVARALRVGLNSAYGQQETRNAIVVVIISLISGLILEILVAATIYLVFKGRVLQVLAFVTPKLAEKDGFMDIIRALVTMAASVASLSLCYAYLPDGRRSPLSQVPGAVATILVCGFLSFGFRLYVDNVDGPTALYGNIATAALFLFWVYLMSNILILGGFLNRLLSEWRRGDNKQNRSLHASRKAGNQGVSVPLSKISKS